jgi:hypothetical protein
MKNLFSLFLCLSCAASAFAGVTVSSPTNGETVTSPFTLSADATSCSSQTVSAMGYSLDSSTSTTIVNNTAINARVSSGTGAHTLHVKAWGNSGAVCVTDVDVNVMPAANAPIIPSGAIKVSSVQALSNWAAIHDAVTSGSASGWTGIVGSPSRNGGTREFATNYTNSGGERYDATFGDDTTATNFIYDAWVYFTSSSSHIANLEMDMNQVMSNGQTVIYGVQCDGYSGTWDYTANRGTPGSPVDVWLHSSAKCNVRNWSTYTWHHLQIQYSRNSSGAVTYKSVWLDGVNNPLNATVPSAFALGWGPVLLTNFQVDGLGSTGSSTVYLDDLTIYRW